MTFVRYFNSIDQSSISLSVRVSMFHHRLPQAKDGEDDSVLDDRCKDAQDAGNNKCLNGIETCGGRRGGIGSVGDNNYCDSINL